MKIVGRKKELSELELIKNSDKPEFVAVYGRRRVGKTYLVNQFFENRFVFKVTGVAVRGKKKVQLANFGESLRKFGSTLCPDPKNWMDAFSMLRTLLENVKGKTEKVVFIDELPYLYTKRCDLIPALEHFWNDWGNTQPRLRLIVCGSATSWIVRNIVNCKGGLHNRLTRKIYLKPFSLSETRDFLKYEGITLRDKEIVEAYMIMGGIPYYLGLMEKGKSLAQNVDEMFFTRKGRLDGEFKNLYEALFEESDNYIKVVEALSRKNKGLTRSELIKATGIKNGGGLTKVLSDLDDCDMIRKYNAYGKTQNGAVYQLTDFYTLFYYKFIRKNSGVGDGFWSAQQNTPTHNAWAGYAFEQLCMYHYAQIERKLGIGGILTRISSWTSSDAQIDLVIDRADKVTDLCEVKFWAGPYSITKKYYQELEHKIQSFSDETHPKGAVHLVMITTEGLKWNEYCGIVQNEVTMADLFD